MLDKRLHPWGVEIAGFGRPFGLAVDAGGRLHVTDMDHHCIYRFDASLEGHDRLGGPEVWNGPHSLDFAADGRGFVTCYYTPGIYVLGSDDAMQLERALTGPASAFVDMSSRLIVSEYSQNAVLAFNGDGALACEFDGRFDRPHMARMLADGTVVVADTWNNKMQRFDGQGGLIDEAVAEVSCPVALDEGARGWLVTAWGDSAVLLFNGSGSYAGRLEAPPLDKPYDARWFGGDRVVVADSHHARVLVLDRPRFH